MMGHVPARMQWPLGRSATVVNRDPVRSVGTKKEKTRRKEDLIPEFGAFDEALFEKLKELRRDIADDEGVPAYHIFHNSTLEALARIKPTTREGAMKIHGIGEHKAERFLDDFLEVIAEHEGV
jgi:ATP-dependent DNA helicase RecQ